ncbi:MAG TPA: SMC family ATPase [Acidimicrobiales bacterium]|nr:SMC family ATPase [Acidimicrobiales bacterium]
MLLTRLYLRNFRVYEDELNLDLPPGLVGIYGPNGSGKSTLLEAITFTLWGRARTGREEIRSSGVGGDCVTELEFDHEGHLYQVRRSLTGINATMKAEALCDGLVMAEGATDTRRYLHSVLGMDDMAFKASVFAEQKQLAAFSSKAPADRRKLVLQLLGITPLDGARDAARRDARTAEEQLRQLRAVLPDLDALTTAADDAEAEAGAAEKLAADEAAVAAAATERAAQAEAAFQRHDQLRQTYDGLVIEGRAAREALDRESELAAKLADDLAGLDQAAADLVEASAEASGLEADQATLAALRAVADAHGRLAAVAVAEEPPAHDPAARDAAAAADGEARQALAQLDGAIAQTTAELDRARQQAARSAALSDEADCPLCGQALGTAFAQVQAHRAAEVADAEARLAALGDDRAAAAEAAKRAAGELTAAERRLREAETAHRAWRDADARRQAAASMLAEARRTLAGLDPDLAAAGADADQTSAARDALARQVTAKEQAARRALGLQVRLERRPTIEADLATARQRAETAEANVVALRDKVKSLGFDRTALSEASAAREATRDAAQAATRSAHAAELAAAGARRDAAGAARRLADGRAQHGQLAELEVTARHLARLAVLMSEFRNTVVASVGPRLAAQAAELFGELTDNEYDQLQVDPETYELQISDAGQVYGLDRFSGSEVDLANLALRVAISEHVRFQSGGAVGLLVLDEVFGPLDEDRKERMLQALEQLRGRFRQVLVVTHDPSIKEQLPNAIEVVKRPGRRATARLLAG